PGRTGDARTPFRFLLVSVVLDIVFNPLLIFGLGPFPALGIAGAAWATLLAQAVAIGGLLLYLRKQGHVLWLGRREVQLFRISPTILRALIVKGVPMGLQMVLISLAMIAMMTLVNGFGTDTAAAYGAAFQLWTYVQMPAMALGAACSTMAAQNVGARLWNRVDATARTGIVANFLMTGVLIVLLILFDRWTLALFLPTGSPTLEVARHLNHIGIWSFLLFGVNFVISGVVRATGAVIPPLLILAFGLWGVRVPLANALIPDLGADGIWWSLPISSMCSMLLSLAYYRWGGWRKARMLTTPAHPAELAAAAEVPAHPASLVAETAPMTELPQSRQR
ncbi:MATE family efflux transporter, partial [Xanthomonas fragariae]|uniref:MATE family efflux transporter n=1 Tax=Xanthomonas fragariae TaxID=48664 RepID=UPI000D55E66E